MIRAIRRSAALAILCGTGLFAADARAQQATVDQLLPADTLMVVSVDDHTTYSNALADMPLGKIMAEPDVQTFLEKPKSMLGEAIAKFQGEIQKQEGFENFELSLDELMNGSYGRVFFALTHVGMPDPQAGQMFPDIGVVFGIEGMQGAPNWQGLIKDVLGRAAGSSGMEMGFQPVTADGYAYEQLMGTPGEGPPVLMATAGNLQLFSLSHNSLRGVLDRASGKGGEGALASSANYRDAAQHLKIDDAGAVRMYLNTSLGLRTLAEGIKLAMTMEGETESLPLVDKLLEKSGLLGLGSVAAASHSVNGVAISRSYAGIKGEPTGLLALGPKQPIDLSVLDIVPKNATSVGIAQFDIAGLYDFCMEMVKTVDEDAHREVTGMIKGFGMQIGGPDSPLDLRNDILGNIGPQMAFMSPQSSNPMMPSFLALVEVKDGAKVVNGLKSLLEFGAQMSGGEFSTKVSTYKEHELVQISVGAEMGMPINPSFAIIGDYLTVSLNVGDLKRHIRRALKPGDNIRSNEDFQRFFSKIPQDANLAGMSYTDIKKSVEDGYSSVVMALPMVTMAADFELPFEMALLPTQEVITQHLFGSLSYTTYDENGAFTEGYSPIGGEAIGLLVGTAAMGGALFAGTRAEAFAEAAPPAPVARLEESPSDQVRYDLSNLKAGATIYKLQNGGLPGSLGNLLEPSDAYPQGCLGRDSLPVDPWGNGYHYSQRGAGYMIWSNGPNGADEQGGGDDIKVEKN